MSDKNEHEEFLKKYKVILPIISPKKYGIKKRAQLREFEKQVLDGEKSNQKSIEK